MTSFYERRLRKLEGYQKVADLRVLVLGIPSTAELTPEEIGQADLVLRVSFVAARNGRPAEGGDHARH